MTEPSRTTSAVRQPVQLLASTAPTAASWQFFHNSSNEFRAKLWSDQKKAGRALGSWAWQWRLAWIRQCKPDQPGSSSPPEFCQEVLAAGLKDRALVVRSEAAVATGRVFAGSKDQKAIERLKEAFMYSRPTRNQKQPNAIEEKKIHGPVWVRERILYALHEIGGTSAKTIGSNLASLDPDLVVYWNKLR